MEKAFEIFTCILFSVAPVVTIAYLVYEIIEKRKTQKWWEEYRATASREAQVYLSRAMLYEEPLHPMHNWKKEGV